MENHTKHKNLEKYKTYLTKEQEYSPLTVKNYLRWVEDYLAFSGDDVSKEKIEEYRDVLVERDIKQKTKNLYLIALRNYITFLNRKGLSTVSTASVQLFRDKNGAKLLVLPTEEQIEVFLGDTKKPLSDITARVLHSTGLRLHEMMNLRKGELTEKFQVMGKGNKQRTVFCKPEVVKQVREWEKNINDGAQIFQCSSNYIQKLFRWRVNYLGVDITAHTLRHIFASRLLYNGADIRSVQELLGHASILTTQRYTHPGSKMLEDTYKKFC